MTETLEQRENAYFFALAYMYICTRDHMSSNSRLFRRLPDVLGLWATVVLSCVCLHLLYIIRTRAKKTHTKHFHAFLFFGTYKVRKGANLSYRKKLKWIRLVRFELTLYLLYATSPAPKPLHYSGRYCPTATHIRLSISIYLISSYIRRKLPITDRR